MKQYDDQLVAFDKAYQQLKSEEELKAFYGKNYPQPEPLYPRFMSLAKKYSEDPVAVEALAWIIVHRSNRGAHWDKTTWRESEDLLIRDHLTSEKLPLVFEGADVDFLNAVSEKSPRRESRGLACFVLADRRIWHVKLVTRWRQENPDWQQPWKQLWYRSMPDYFASFVTADIDQETNETEKLLERIVREFADVSIADHRNGKTLGDLAKGHLHEIRDLGIGKPAPPLTSINLDGNPVHLADLKERVVVLDVWATWCGACIAMNPHESELVKRLADKPFVLVSISVDDNRETVTKFLEKQPMPWPHWFNGPDGRIIADLNVWLYPTIYVLDDKGVIRYKDVRGKLLDQAVDSLLNEIANRPPSK